MIVLTYFLAALVGISLGALGGGGSILAVPILVYVARLPAKEAIASSLLVVGGTSAVGALRHWRYRNIDIRAALFFGTASMGGSFLGGRAARSLSGTLQLTIFAVVMLAAAIFMFRSGRKEQELPGVRRPVWSALAGFGVGVLTGVVGVGGGFLIVPALVLLTALPMNRAIGTSLLVIAMNSVSGFLGYLGKVSIDWRFALTFTLIAAAGVVVGSSWARDASPAALKKAFAIFLVVVAAIMLVENATRSRSSSSVRGPQAPDPLRSDGFAFRRPLLPMTLTRLSGVRAQKDAPFLPTPARMSLRVVWTATGETVEVTSAEKQFAFKGWKAEAKIEAQVEVPSIGFRWKSDPIETSRAAFAVIGRDTNGRYFSS